VNPLALLSSLFRALAEGLGLVRQRDAALNAPEIKANADAAVDQKIKDEAGQAVSSGNLDQIRKLASE